jgi:Notch-like protein
MSFSLSSTGLAQSGELVSEYATKFEYQYDMIHDNSNDQTIQKFSTDAKEDMFYCESGCPYDDYTTFYNWYGAFDYADQIISAAGKGVETTLFKNGNIDFSAVNVSGRGAAILSVSVHMSIFMRIIRQMERALDDCHYGTKVDPTRGVISWDSAVALYTGSLEGVDGSGEGLLLYSLADGRCMDFSTCGIEGDGTRTGKSYVNFRIFEEFRKGQERLQQGFCPKARKNKERIVQLMRVPLVQSLLRNAWLQSNDNDNTDKTKAEGATLASAIVPFINACDDLSGSMDAKTIYENMRLDSDNPPNFEQVRSAMEQNYACLNITCKDVGGLWDANSDRYIEDAGLCGQPSSSSSSYSSENDNGVAAAVGVSGVVFVGIIVAFVSYFCDRKVRPNTLYEQPSVDIAA